MTKLQNARFKKSNFASYDEAVFDSDMLKLLMAIDENKPILQIAKEINMDPVVFKESFLRLFKLKLIEEVKPQVAYVDESFLTILRDTLINLTGPLGEMLLEDTAEKMNYVIPKIPKTNVADFVYQIAQEIPGDKEQAEFKKIMLKEIKSLG